MRGPTPDSDLPLPADADVRVRPRRRPARPRCSALGISHVYLSPVTEAVPGSTHGYDVVDHAQVRDELGGVDGLTALLDACAERGMGVVVDHVPEPHRRRATPSSTRAGGRCCATVRTATAARWFDVDWDAADGKVILPVLGEPLDDVARATSTVVGGELRLGAAALAAGARHRAAAAGRRRSRRQHYRAAVVAGPGAQRAALLHDRRPRRPCGSRTPIVAAVVDTVPRLLADHPAFAGVRVDHVDGLADPLAYLDGLRAAASATAGCSSRRSSPPDETLPPVVAGATARPATSTPRSLEHALLDRDGWAALRDRWVAVTGDDRPFRAWELEARREVLDGGLRPDLERVARVPRRRRRRRRRGRPELSVAPRALPHVPARRRGPAGARRGASTEAAEARPDLAAAARAAGRAALGRAGRVADPLAAADRAGDGQGRRGPGVLALPAAGVARRGRCATALALRSRPYQRLSRRYARAPATASEPSAAERS